jgi:hypothetical protein
MNAQMKHKQHAKTVSIGFHRDDGDFQLLATLNNNDEFLSGADFEELVISTVLRLGKSSGECVVALHRQDAPDYVAMETEDVVLALPGSTGDPVRYFLGMIKEVNGGMEYSDKYLFQTAGDPGEYAEGVAKTWRGDEDAELDEDGCGYWSSATFIKNEGYVEIPELEFQVMARHLAVL